MSSNILKFEHNLLVSKSWGEKMETTKTSLELTHVAHHLKRGYDVDRVTDMILKKANNKKYNNLSVVNFKNS